MGLQESVLEILRALLDPSTMTLKVGCSNCWETVHLLKLNPSQAKAQFIVSDSAWGLGHWPDGVACQLHT